MLIQFTFFLASIQLFKYSSRSDPSNPFLSSLLLLSELPVVFMDLPEKLFFAAFLILSVAIDGTQADTMVTGTVFCDQCKDGQRSLFDYPINGEI